MNNLDLLTIYVVLSPLVVVALGAAVYWLTGWMDRHGQRGHAAE
jgi:hypothetical protein